ncbi:cytochrome c biogenesis protein [Methylophaga marina]|uniref:Cytochrome c biogenesis protein ResB n=1 Tax=Methylophaga marina TaxID=45495 RepID=A0ABN0TAQ8_9GAMM|nr:cytochrome c biogenesis protein ResB [Methylophaga marina]BDZ74280.1 cytochrome c biogenesis protein [Methylophaga marina]
MSQNQDSSVSHRSLAWRVFHFLGTMELAITLLITLAIASVIGTVLQQNQPYPDYLIKFGPYWFEVFEKLGLYDVYSALWFLAILALLVVSTTVCVIRHAPSMFKDMFNLRTHVQLKSLRSMHHRSEWETPTSPEQTVDAVNAALASDGFRTRVTEKSEGNTLVSAMRGGMNRLGYILTHVAIIVICVGGLFDSNLPLKLAEWQGRIQVETRNLPLPQVPKESRLPVGPQAFRGSVSIPEGRAASVAYLAMRDGYLVQNLPFTIEVKEFRIEHYPTGQPKSFESDLVIHDTDLEKPLESTIAVNHPLIYKGYAIYQASFGDGGSELTLKAWPLFSDKGEPVSLETKVFNTQQMLWGDKEMQLEITDFRPFNINPDPTDDNPNNVRNFGPSVTFKLRQPTGEALEYQNYMNPVERDGRYYFLSGVRGSPSEEFAYLYIPADENDSIEGFYQFLKRLHNKNVVKDIAEEMKLATLSSLQTTDDVVLADSLQKTLETLIEMFNRGGFGEVSEFIEKTLPEAERDALAPAYLAMLREMLGRIYFSGLELKQGETVDQSEVLFLQDAIDAIGTLPRYGSPVYLEMSDFTQIQSTGLQIAHAPGKSIVYLGCAFLIAGVFLLFYLPQRRFWVWVREKDGKSQVYLAGMTNRNPREFDNYFEDIKAKLQSKSRNSDEG